jgi:hypothetical protein
MMGLSFGMRFRIDGALGYISVPTGHGPPAGRHDDVYFVRSDETVEANLKRFYIL